MRENITEIKVLEILSQFHDECFTVESLASELEVDRQSVAPYISNLINEGIIIPLMSAIFVRIKDGRAASRPVTTFALTCHALTVDQKDLLFGAYLQTYESLMLRMSHPSIVPGGIRFDGGWFGIQNKLIWIRDDYECETCGFKSNNYIRAKTGGPIKKVSEHFLLLKKS